MTDFVALPGLLQILSIISRNRQFQAGWSFLRNNILALFPILPDFVPWGDRKRTYTNKNRRNRNLWGCYGIHFVQWILLPQEAGRIWKQDPFRYRHLWSKTAFEGTGWFDRWRIHKSERHDGGGLLYRTRLRTVLHQCEEVPFPITHERLSGTVYEEEEFELDALLGKLTYEALESGHIQFEEYSVYCKERILQVLNEHRELKTILLKLLGSIRQNRIIVIESGYIWSKRISEAGHRTRWMGQGHAVAGENMVERCIAAVTFLTSDKRLRQFRGSIYSGGWTCIL